MSHDGGGGSDARARSSESYTWPLVTLLAVILPQILIPPDHRVGPPLAIPIIEGAAFLTLAAIAALPGAVPRSARPIVIAALSVLAVANAIAAGRLVVIVLSGGSDHHPPSADRLLVAGALVLLANLVTFALLYWQLDGGGPATRVESPRAQYPDFQFPQLVAPENSPPDWRPRYPDFLYLAYTNVVAFSPTDTIPLTGRAKGLMAVQSMTSLTVLVVVLARVINILPS